MAPAFFVFTMKLPAYSIHHPLVAEIAGPSIGLYQFDLVLRRRTFGIAVEPRERAAAFVAQKGGAKRVNLANSHHEQPEPLDQGYVRLAIY